MAWHLPHLLESHFRMQEHSKSYVPWDSWPLGTSDNQGPPRRLEGAKHLHVHTHALAAPWTLAPEKTVCTRDLKSPALPATEAGTAVLQGSCRPAGLRFRGAQWRVEAGTGRGQSGGGAAEQPEAVPRAWAGAHGPRGGPCARGRGYGSPRLERPRPQPSSAGKQVAAG